MTVRYGSSVSAFSPSRAWVLPSPWNAESSSQSATVCGVRPPRSSSDIPSSSMKTPIRNWSAQVDPKSGFSVMA